MSTIFWPRDVPYDGYFYGWIKHHTVCVAGVLKTNTVSQIQTRPPSYSCQPADRRRCNSSERNPLE